MPVSEKEIIERLPDWIAEKKTSFLFGSGTSAPGMPLMNMFPGKKDGSTDVDGLMYEIIKRNKFLIGAKMKINVSEEESKAILGTLGAYKKFIEILLDMLGNVNARERHKNINIFTTNYDLFIEKAVDDIYESGSTAPFIFNDGARGYFNRLLDNSNFDTTTAYKGRFDNYINELPSINLAKIHGSVSWKKQSEDMIRVCNYVVRDKPEKRETVKPDGNEPKATTLKKHYYEMLRFFEYEMSESAENIGNGSLLIVHGFSFGDKHIVHALKRALENRELLVIIVAYTDNDVEVIKRNLKDLAERKNLRFLCPKDFSFHGEEFSRLDLNNFNKIIAGKVRDQLNTINSKEFDNRFHAQSIQRIVRVKSQGVIKEGQFSVTSSTVPMVGNVLVSASSEDIAAIFSRGVDEEKSVTIGRSLMENQPIRIPINDFFASHIGIFGNTGSGKSNTLHKLYLELFSSPYGNAALGKSIFAVIDFNGEYGSGKVFGKHQVNVFDGAKRKILIDENIFFNANVLKILAKATENTQSPFLSRTLKQWEEHEKNICSDMQIGLLKKCLQRRDIALVEEWRSVARDVLQENSDDKIDCMNVLETVSLFKGDSLSYLTNAGTGFINQGRSLDEVSSLKKNDNSGKYVSCIPSSDLKLEAIGQELEEKGKSLDLFDSFLVFIKFQKIYDAMYKGMQLEWLKPVVGRLERLFSSVKKYAEIIKNATECYTKGISVFNLKNVDTECKETFALLLSKMLYENKKNDSNCASVHLIIDEAHNILNSFKSTHSDVWEDYRLTTFETMIKEGRKYGFFLTIASQRPADISPTIMSQIHNYIIHKLVNDKDLQMLENTMPTLDAFSKSRIPTLGKGEAVLTGRAFGMPSLIKVDYEEYSRPDSDDVDLIAAWSENPEASK